MNARHAAIALALGISAATPAAGESFLPFDPSRPLDGVVRPDDVGAFFDYLREAYTAAIEGREAPRTDALQRRGEAIAEELKLRGHVAGILLLNTLERHLKEIVREPTPRQSLPQPVPQGSRL